VCLCVFTLQGQHKIPRLSNQRDYLEQLKICRLNIMLKMMRKLFYILTALLLLPVGHRMGCGARGIYNSPQQLESAQPEKSIPIKMLDNNTS
jgi:hypothetical protein